MVLLFVALVEEGLSLGASTGLRLMRVFRLVCVRRLGVTRPDWGGARHTTKEGNGRMNTAPGTEHRPAAGMSLTG